MITSDDLDLLEHLHRQAADGPWVWKLDNEDVITLVNTTGFIADVWDAQPPALPPAPPDGDSVDRARANAEFMAFAHLLVPKLIDTVRELQARLDEPLTLAELDVDILDGGSLWRRFETVPVGGVL